MKNKQQENRKFRLIGILAIILTSTFVFANTKNTKSFVSEQTNNFITDEDTTVFLFNKIDKKPKFPGGIEQLLKYLSENIKYPKTAKDAGIQGKVYISFVINKNGEVTDVKAIKGVSKELDEEAIRVISTMPNWSPGIQNGKKVKVKYIIPINFKLPKKSTNMSNFADINKHPEFPEGEEALQEFLIKNTKYPKAAKEAGIQGRVFVQFVINKKGKVKKIKVRKGINKELDKEAKRVVSSMPDWIPAEKNGKKVKVKYIIPINFKLNNDNTKN